MIYTKLTLFGIRMFGSRTCLESGIRTNQDIWSQDVWTCLEIGIRMNQDIWSQDVWTCLLQYGWQ